MTIHALVPQCALSVLSCSEFKIAKIFWNSPLDPTGECLQHPPRLSSYTMVFLLTMLVEKPAAPKNCWIRH